MSNSSKINRFKRIEFNTCHFICRCFIPECESINATKFNQEWLSNAIPNKNGRPEKCSRYAIAHQSNPLQTHESCSESLFNRSEIIGCMDYVFKTDEHRIMKEVSFVFTYCSPMNMYMNISNQLYTLCMLNTSGKQLFVRALN